MKKWCYALAAVALMCVFGLPFSEYDAAALLPIRTVQAIGTPQGITILSEVGCGEGKSWEEAVSDLRRNAAGRVFFDTAEQVVFCGRAPVRAAVESGVLRPSAQVYFLPAPMEPEGLNDYLSAHESDLTVADLRAGYNI